MVKHDEVTPFGYVIFDRYWKTTREKIANFLQRFDVYAIGRYGSWTYSLMQDALYDGFRIIDKLKRKHVG
jgi:hypothetical protein